MNRSFDAIVVGLGAMGSAALRALSRRGLSVLGIDRYAPPHAQGSSHGLSRIIREAYFEHPAYVPLVQRAYQLWRELERESGETLMLETGGLMVGEPGGVLVEGALRSARQHRLVYEELSAVEIHHRFPAFHPGPLMIGVWEPRAGVLYPERCIAAMLAAARRHGAITRENEPVVSWRHDGEGFEVVTARDRYRAGRIVLSAGAWLDRLLPDLSLSLSVERLVLFWLEPASDPDHFDPARCPISIWEHERDRFFYAFPRLEGRVKVARHHEGEIAEPDTLRREVGGDEIEPLRAMLARHMPGANGRLCSSAVCMYANTRDGHFIIDRHPEHREALVVSACSGHGFKFAPAIGEACAELLVDGASRFDLSMFRLGR